MTAVMPTDITYGKVVGRFLMAIGDGPDAGRTPDPVAPVTLQVAITSKAVVVKSTTPPVSILPQRIVCTIDTNGDMLDPQGAVGVWLLTGVYTVTYVSTDGIVLPAHDIQVLAAHTETSPLNLTMAAPAGSVASPSQYAALDARMTTLETEVTGLTEYQTLNLSGPSTYTVFRDTTLDVSLSGDAVLTLAGEQLGAVVALRVDPNGHTLTLSEEVTISGSDPETVTAWRMAEGWIYGLASGSVTVPSDPNDATAPSNPTNIVGVPAPNGFALSWTASTDNVAVAGYEVSVDNGEWVDSGANLTHTITGLTSGTEHYGRVRAYDGNGNRSTGARWPTTGTIGTTVAGLHDQLLALNAPIYVRLSNGLIEQFGTDDEMTWTNNGVTFNGPALTQDGTSSAKFYGGSTGLRSALAPAFIGLTGPVSIVATFRGVSGSGAPRLIDADPAVRSMGITSGTAGNEASTNGVNHLFVFTIDVAQGAASKKTYRDGLVIGSEAWVVENQSAISDGMRIGNWQHGIGAAEFCVDRVLFLPGTALTQMQAEGLAKAAGTWGNPR